MAVTTSSPRPARTPSPALSAAGPRPLQARTLGTLSHIGHGFFTRAGGTSGGLYDSLNCAFASRDNPARVADNRARVAATMGLDADSLLTVRQVHGTHVITVERSWTADEAPQADGLVTRLDGIGLGILTADCGPVLFADPRHGVIGAAHAGWRGLLAGVLEETLAAMGGLGAVPETVHAAIGPCIGAASYEVGEELHKAFCEADPTARRHFTATDRKGHFLFDLQGCIRARLRRLGVARIGQIDADTAADEARFFSYRRACQNEEADFGRQISVICRSSGTAGEDKRTTTRKGRRQ